MAHLFRLHTARALNGAVVKFTVETKKYSLRRINVASKPAQAISTITTPSLVQARTASDTTGAIELPPPPPPLIDMSISDFAEISKMKYYVDKTLLIHKMLNDQRVLLVTAPKLYGKSTMISMLKYFFEIQTVDVDGKIVAEFNLDEKSGKAITNTSNYELFMNRKVANNPCTMKHLGKYPVIHLDLKAQVGSNEEALFVCRTAIHKSYLEHECLKKSRKVSLDVRKFVRKWCDKTEHKNMDWSDVQYAMEFLSRFLFEHWGKRCIFLVDDYNSITDNYSPKNYSPGADYHAVGRKLGSMLLFALKTNNYMERAFLTGRDKYGSECLPINSTEENNTAWGKRVYSSFYGLTDGEVKILFARAGFAEETSKAVMSNCYGKDPTLTGYIYSIQSMMKCLVEKKYRNSMGSDIPLE